MYVQTKKQTIPNKLLNEFVESKVGYKDIAKIVSIKCHFLWSRDGIDRYRINVWIGKHLDAEDLDVTNIGYSFFVHYDNDNETLEDHTIGSK